MSMIEKLNGNKKKVIGWGSGGVIAFILVNLYSMTGKVNATEATVEAQGVVVQELKKLPERVKGVETEIKNLDKTFVDFRTEQRKANDKILGAIQNNG